MGGLVASLYATGQDARQMTEFVDAIDWPELLRINTPFKDLSFRRKEDRRQFPTALEFGLRGGFKLPMGLSPGHGVGLVISRATAPYARSVVESGDCACTRPARRQQSDSGRATRIRMERFSRFDRATERMRRELRAPQRSR